MQIRTAKIEEYQDIIDFYYNLIDDMQDCEYHPMWIKGVYPDPEMLKEQLESGNIIIGTIEEKIVSCMIVNHSCNESYNKVTWPTEAAPDKITVIHALGVSVSHMRQGIAKQMVSHVIDFCRKTGQSVIRLDVLVGNKPAETIYPQLGFKSVIVLPMYYEDTGWTDFELFEFKF